MVGMGSSDPIDPSGLRLLSEPDIGCQRGRKRTRASGHQKTLTASLSLSCRQQAREQARDGASWVQSISALVAPDALLHWSEADLPSPSLMRLHPMRDRALWVSPEVALAQACHKDSFLLVYLLREVCGAQGLRRETGCLLLWSKGGSICCLGEQR